MNARSTKYDSSNLLAARAVLEDVDKHGGETAALVIWARLTVAHDAERKRAEQ